MGLGVCGLLCKYVVIVLNTLFAITGLVMLGLGLWLRFSSQTGGLFNIDVNTKPFVIGVMVLIVTGAVMLIISAFGEFGACSENRIALNVFSFLLGLVAAMEIITGVLAFVYSDEVAGELSVFYKSVYTQYVSNGGESGPSITLKIFHNALKCCGIGGALEPFVRDTCPKTSGFIETLTIPPCPGVIENVFKTKGTLVLGLFVGTAVLMICALVCCRILIKQMSSLPSPRKEYSQPPVVY
ncbi:CD9 antigen-like isoform X1 [Megalops cyprinoides]|uniref:CD9 antigen-like isoform X1 n=1 Tax=Megalops cyprinoides TaxID=118141 RepID=UPI001864AF70|nr:CD9 antigen-like isoform X1 [Megalops cyprinoides]